MKTIEDYSTRIILILTTILFICLATTKRANAQFDINVPLVVQYNNQFDDASEWLNLGVEQFLVDTVAPYGSFVSNYMGAINSFTQTNGFAMLDLDAQMPTGSTQYAELGLLVPILAEGHDNYGFGIQSYYGAYDGMDSVYVKVTKNGGLDTLIRLHADLPAGSIEDSTHYVDLSSFIQSGDTYSLNFIAYSGWGLAWMLDDLVALAWNPTVVISGIEDLPTFNGVREVTAIYNLLGQPINDTKVKGTYIRQFNDGTTDKITVR